VIGVSRPPVLDCGTTFHLDYGGRDLPSTPSDNLWKLICLATEALSDSWMYRRYINKFIYLSIYLSIVCGAGSVKQSCLSHRSTAATYSGSTFILLIIEFAYTQRRIGRKKPTCQNPARSVHPFRNTHRLVRDRDTQTDKHRAIASTRASIVSRGKKNTV